jgi:S1-C subfamily serine protease
MPNTSLADFSREIAGLVAATAPAIAAVHASRHHSSSAVHWRDGLFVAASETIETEDDITLTLPAGNNVSAEFVGRDPTTGIAVLKSEIPEGSPTLKPAGQIEVGSLVVAVGRGETTVAGYGIVSEAGPAWRSMRGGLIDRRIRLSASIDTRAEGGAAIDAEGGFVGLVLFGPRRRALVIPAETVDRVAATLAKNGHMPRGYLGAGLHPVRQSQVQGAMVMSLEEGGPAEKAGLVLGDIITSWGDEKVDGVRDLIRRLGPDSVGKTIMLGLLRGGAERSVEVTIGARPRS